MFRRAARRDLSEEDIYNMYVSFDPADPRSPLWEARLYRARGDEENAMASYRSSIELYKEIAERHNPYRDVGGNFRAHIETWISAGDVIEEAGMNDIASSRYYLHAVLACIASKRYKKARALAKKVPEINVDENISIRERDERCTKLIRKRSGKEQTLRKKLKRYTSNDQFGVPVHKALRAARKLDRHLRRYSPETAVQSRETSANKNLARSIGDDPVHTHLLEGLGISQG